MLQTRVEIPSQTCNIRVVRFALACSLAALAVLLAGCGGHKSSSSTTTGAQTTTAAPNGVESKSADGIVTAMQAAVAHARSVHVVGGGTSGGTAIALDLKLVRNRGGAGHIAVGGLGFDIIRIGNKLYFKGERKFLVHYAGSAAAQLLAGKWFVVSSSTTGFGSFAPLTDLKALISQILSSHGALKKGSTTTIGGQPAIAVIDKTNGATLYVATTGPAYPLALTPSAKRGKGAIKFSSWNQAVPLKAPPKPINYAKLTGG